MLRLTRDIRIGVLWNLINRPTLENWFVYGNNGQMRRFCVCRLNLSKISNFSSWTSVAGKCSIATDNPLFISTIRIYSKDRIQLSLSLFKSLFIAKVWLHIRNWIWKNGERKVTIMAVEMHTARTLSTRNDCEKVGKEVSLLQLDHVIGHSSTKPTIVKYICTVQIVIVVFWRIYNNCGKRMINVLSTRCL